MKITRGRLKRLIAEAVQDIREQEEEEGGEEEGGDEGGDVLVDLSADEPLDVDVVDVEAAEEEAPGMTSLDIDAMTGREVYNALLTMMQDAGGSSMGIEDLEGAVMSETDRLRRKGRSTKARTSRRIPGQAIWPSAARPGGAVRARPPQCQRAQGRGWCRAAAPGLLRCRSTPEAVPRHPLAEQPLRPRCA